LLDDESVQIHLLMMKSTTRSPVSSLTVELDYYPSRVVNEEESCQLPWKIGEFISLVAMSFISYRT
jgi:hypothetical protein